MGGIKIGDLIIVTDVLYYNGINNYAKTARELIGTIHKVEQLDCTNCPFPYKITVGTSSFWVEAIPYSPLMVELL